MFVSIGIIISAVFFIVFILLFIVFLLVQFVKITHENTKLVDKVVRLTRQLQDEKVIVDNKNTALCMSYNQLDKIKDIINGTT